ncbi:MAG: phosphomevalonate kinase [Brevibacterium sp.]|uniref:phosphomevalonate kinase n=1 Tax=Brevibacterium sp. TaxID=1701 RepID=UPI00264A2B41|nr:phosphomevalonate kinase [Brevibacterium sp.]MDN5807025.1 phosphomevalonate kinase [Brevibacterium sp.]MDN5833407.1 phosphomevalonate kinase [Brevibacterium sp.]MDN5875926.1 phosphomevalonate kinase [Brevibacterium sp.]MDN5908915.1 phosphomevalonate kinase [Brevibacterium sp.]MDN6134048.1 phosphomevalonate kinase [Brevibacterium sp.]
MIETRAPGKLFVAGEYAVVEPGQPAVLVAVDRYITVRLSESCDVGRIHSSEYGKAPLVWVREAEGNSIVVDHRPTDYVLSAIDVVEELRAEIGTPPRYFDLDISSELDDASGRKFGLGSSGAVTTATIAALDEFYTLGLTRTERFKLALLATIAVAPNASCGDIAASTFGGWIRFTSPDREALGLHRQVHGVASALACREWEGSGANRLTPPDSLQLLVGWTGSPASTERLVKRVRIPGTAAPQPYESFTADSRACVDALVASFEADDGSALECIRRARRLLQRLGTASGSQIETEQLRSLCDIAETYGAAAKPSGAGGGDCGIALSEADLPTIDILREWERHGIQRLSLSPHRAEGGIDEF